MPTSFDVGIDPRQRQHLRQRQRHISDSAKRHGSHDATSDRDRGATTTISTDPAAATATNTAAATNDATATAIRDLAATATGWTGASTQHQANRSRLFHLRLEATGTRAAVGCSAGSTSSWAGHLDPTMPDMALPALERVGKIHRALRRDALAVLPDPAAMPRVLLPRVLRMRRAEHNIKQDQLQRAELKLVDS